MKLVVATRNRGKLREVAAVLGPLGFTPVSAEEAGFIDEIEEDADTFAGNAEKKARAVHAATGLPALGDDSGLEVDALDGAPGVRSARYAGDGHDDGANNRKLLEALAGVPEERRSARFRCALAFVAADGSLVRTDGVCEGRILGAPRGAGGFGYDPLFLPAGETRTMAELALEEKNRISHRGRALARLASALARP